MTQTIAVGICKQLGVTLDPITTGWVGPSHSVTDAFSGSESASTPASESESASLTDSDGSETTVATRHRRRRALKHAA